LRQEQAFRGRLETAALGDGDKSLYADGVDFHAFGSIILQINLLYYGLQALHTGRHLLRQYSKKYSLVLATACGGFFFGKISYQLFAIICI